MNVISYAKKELFWYRFWGFGVILPPKISKEFPDFPIFPGLPFPAGNFPVPNFPFPDFPPGNVHL